jgi:hypothetical protein
MVLHDLFLFGENEKQQTNRACKHHVGSSRNLGGVPKQQEDIARKDRDTQKMVLSFSPPRTF